MAQYGGSIKHDIDFTLMADSLSPQQLTRDKDLQPFWNQEFIEILQNPLRHCQSTYHVVTMSQTLLTKRITFRINSSAEFVEKYFINFFETCLRKAGWSVYVITAQPDHVLIKIIENDIDSVKRSL